MKKKPGVYLIHIPASDKMYVGSGISISNRVAYHKWKLKNDCHDNKHLQRSFNKHGFAYYYVLEYCDNCAEREQYWIDNLKPEFNMRKVAESNAGMKWSTKRDRKLSDEELEEFRRTHVRTVYNPESVRKAVIMCIESGNVIHFKSIKEASEITGIHRDVIGYALRTKKMKKKSPKIWKYA
jgi:group I intron endonuclease